MGCTNCNSAKSFKGQKGDSAYTVWLNAGNSGTEAQFLASLIGADGTNGIYLLYNNVTQVVSSGAALQNLMTYTLQQANASSTPFEDGDIIKVEAGFTSDGLASNKLIQVFFDAQSLSLDAMTGDVGKSLKVEVNITRVNATTVVAERDSKYMNGFTFFTAGANFFNNSVPAVSNMDTTDIVIACKGDGVVNADITQQYMRVYLIKQP